MIRRVGRVIVVGLVCAGCSAQPHRETGEQRVGDLAAPAAYLAGTESRLVTSRVGRTYQVSVALPRGYESTDASYPVLYALDANGEFGIVVETARMLQLGGLVPELVIVGIGYPVGHYFDAAGPRTLDLTPTHDPDLEALWVSRMPGWPLPEGSGGGADFLAFLSEELIPLVESEYRTDPRDRALLGHSLGGLFAFYALLHGEGIFHRFISASPFLAWDDRVIFEHEAAYAAAHDELPARVFFSVGMLEPDGLPDEDPWGGYITNLRDLIRVLSGRGYADFEWTVEYFEDETHTSVLPGAVSRGLRHIYAAN